MKDEEFIRIGGDITSGRFADWDDTRQEAVAFNLWSEANRLMAENSALRDLLAHVDDEAVRQGIKDAGHNPGIILD